MIMGEMGARWICPKISFIVFESRAHCHTRESGYPDLGASAAVALDSRVRGNDTSFSTGASSNSS
jgi:hypothetical protein